MAPLVDALIVMGLVLGPFVLWTLVLIWYDHGSGTGLDPCANRSTCKLRKNK